MTNDDEIVMSFADYRASLDIRPNYLRLKTRVWTKDECLHWMMDYGAFDCAMNYCTAEELRQEVLLQKAGLGL